MDLTLRDGVNLQQAIQTAKDIDQQSKASGFNQHALDQMARQCFSNARFEIDVEEGLDLVHELYRGENLHQPMVELEEFNIQQGLKESVTTLN